MRALNLQSPLTALQLYEFQVETHCPGQVVYDILAAEVVIPGVILTEDNAFYGVISRRCFLEAMSRAYGRELFLRRPIGILYEFIAADILQLPGATLVTEAAHLTLQRPTDLLYEPLVVKLAPQSYRLVDVHQLLMAQAEIHRLTSQLLREKTHAELMQNERLASLGRLLAGVAHEIRNPVNFIWNNLQYLSEYSLALIDLVGTWDADAADRHSQIQHLKQTYDFSFIAEDLPKILGSLETGTDRLRHLVESLRTLSRMDEKTLTSVDVHVSLENTLLILSNQIKTGIEVSKQYGELPMIDCYAGQLGQVFMNIISNAIDSLQAHQASLKPELVLPTGENATVPASSWEPRISVTTALCSKLPVDADDTPTAAHAWISVRIADNGPGIPESVQRKIFDDFFTTKPIGKGTGLGLSISRDIVVNHHQGQLILRSPCLFSAETQRAYGAEFEILLPLIPAEILSPVAQVPPRLAEQQTQPAE
ncbi:MAG: HAMP domain-containing histidine kinase [Leptolyngbyaceae cyanobacterium SL_1_1]|nr:HAMP domain-containing histidine kinase [Leptolyngbyaceae cyanobacterium RM1_1_2]NJO08519.1 HAMP domain-containing histidine kinase [Leptolyngbyaceae cyanobacterium SL_1_1]